MGLLPGGVSICRPPDAGPVTNAAGGGALSSGKGPASDRRGALFQADGHIPSLRTCETTPSASVRPRLSSG